MAPPPVPWGSGVGSLAEPGPGHWVQTMDREDAVAAALRLQQDAGIMTTNLQVLDQFVTSLNRMSSEVLHVSFGSVAARACGSAMNNLARVVPA